MRGLSRASGLGLLCGLLGGAITACYNDDYLLGALCKRDSDCGSGQCCSSKRCRNDDTDLCLSVGMIEAYLPAYSICSDDAECLEFGIPFCVILPGTTRGFCADLCIGNSNIDCDRHVFGAPLSTLSRTCVEHEGQSLCALDCSRDGLCPDEMQCREGVCVPTP